ncbi:hypothetical protein HPB47_015016 [Ixodes persulcatus]|uniref:Uncharacterized protein n=1 Tax=Ixodes persulcatus TaxID=34615 RepID=A0AC60QUP1_IXOPE|nr:hypothetical protein HPB47_015016 [Ixodes persulcatus]
MAMSLAVETLHGMCKAFLDRGAGDPKVDVLGHGSSHLRRSFRFECRSLTGRRRLLPGRSRRLLADCSLPHRSRPFLIRSCLDRSLPCCSRLLLGCNRGLLGYRSALQAHYHPQPCSVPIDRPESADDRPGSKTIRPTSFLYV